LWCGVKDSLVSLSDGRAGTVPNMARFRVMTGQLKHLPPAALCAAVAMIGGLLGGTTAVQGLRQNDYGPVDPPSLIHRSETGGHAGETVDIGYGEIGASDCTGCSERDLGYRWATLAAVRSPDQCPNDSWGFRRGCLDYTGGV